MSTRVAAFMPVGPKRDALGDVAGVLVASVLGVLALFMDFEEEVGAVALVDVVLVLAAAMALLFRRHQPIVVAVIVVALRMLSIRVSGSEIALIGAIALAFYALGRSDRARWPIMLAVVTALATTGIIVSSQQGESYPQELLGEMAAAALPAVYGSLRSSQEQRLAAAIDAEASSRVQAERLRIARDLHDVVAHGLATIAVQSGTAAYNLPAGTETEPARVALAHINTVGKRSLEDLRSMVGVLRSSDRPADNDALPLRPTPTNPDDLTSLREAAALAGVDLTIEASGSFPDDTGDATLVATHRIAQEAITNIARHAGAVPATLELRHGADELALRIVNTTTAQGTTAQAPTVPSTGVGIVGMSERAESLGGSLEAKPLVGGGFEVRATLPYRRVMDT